ncbi:BCCT family transporter [Staphylococcus aureus]
MYNIFFWSNISETVRKPRKTLLHCATFFLVLFIARFSYFICLCVYFILRYANISLGEEGGVAQFSFASWFAMLFSAGAIDCVLNRTTISHAFKLTPIHKADQSAINDAMQFSFFHWGF